MEEETYQQFIRRIIETRGKHGCGEEYHERHHIIPKCLGGSNDESNMIDLYAKEHYIAHKLLAKENPHNKKLQYAWWCMASMKNSYTSERYQCTPEEYEEAKKTIATIISNEFKTGERPSLDARRKMSEAKIGNKNPMYNIHLCGEESFRHGKHHTEEAKKKISQNSPRLSGKDNPMYGKYGDENPNYGMRYHLSEEAKKNISDSHKGVKNARHRPVMCIETGEVFWGGTEVQEKLGIPRSNITACCQGRLKTAGGYHWKYVES